MEAAAILAEQGIEATVLRLMTVAPLNMEYIVNHLSEHHHVVVVEEICADSGIRQELAWNLHRMVPGCRVDGIDLGRQFVTQGDIKTLYRHYGLDARSIVDFTMEVLRREN